MLSIYTLKSASQAAHYYEQGDYYIKGDSLENNDWFGKGAAELGLQGAIDPKQFKKLLEGELPNGVILKHSSDENGKQKHRPGYDLTFSACKSASILAIVGGDERISKAHIAAVKTVLTNIENNLAGTRVKTQGAVNIAPTNNIVAAMFNHTDSRLLDPNLHTHCIILNMTKFNDQWRALYGDQFYNLKMALGLEYRMHFAQNLMKLGYEIEQTSKNGLFEIANVPKDLIAHFSKRRQEIERIIDNTGKDGSEKITITINKGTQYEKTVNTIVSSMATIYSRAKKKVLHQDELQQHWTEQLQFSGHSRQQLDEMINESKSRGEVLPLSPIHSLKEAIPMAIAHVTSNKQLFNERELVLAIKGLCLKSNINDKLINKQLEDLKLSGDILITKYGALTTKTAQRIESDNMALFAHEKNTTFALVPFISSFVTKHFVKDASKIEILNSILSTKDRFIAIDSSSEIDMHKLLKDLCRITPHFNHYVISKNHKAAQELGSFVKTSKSFSTTEFINYTNWLISKDKGDNNAAVWIVNRAQQLSYKELNNLLTNAKEFDAKIIFTGDTFRVPSHHKGNQFKHIVDNLQCLTLSGANTTSTTMIRDNNIENALDLMFAGNHVEYIKNSEQRFMQACKYVAALDHAVLLVQNNSMVIAANAAIREYMLESGKLHGQTIQLSTLKPVTLSNQEKSTVVSFSVGDTIRFNSDIQNTEFKQGQYYTIIDVNANKNMLSLKDDQNVPTTLNFSPYVGSKLAVYRPNTISLQVGEQFIWNDNTPSRLNTLDLKKGDGLVVTAIENNIIHVLSGNSNKSINIYDRIAQHVDYGYSKAISAVQEQHNINGAILIEPDTFPKVAPQDLYIALKSFAGDPKIFSHDKQELVAYLRSNIPQIQTASDAQPYKTTGTVNDKQQPVKEQHYSAHIAIDYAIAKLAEREAVFSNHDLKLTAYSYDIQTPIKELEDAITHLERDGTLIAVDKNQYVFKEIYDCEKECLDIQARGIGKVAHIMSADHMELSNLKRNSLLTTGQKEAITLCLTSTDRINLIQGVAGSGKTTMLKEFKDLARNSGYELVGIANTASAKINLHLKSTGDLYNVNDPKTFTASGMQSQTLASFIIANEKLLQNESGIAKLIYPENTILVLDEASLVSVRAMKSLLNIAEQLNLRLVIIGDDRQLPPIEASRVFSLMLGKSENAVNMNINTRLKTPDALEIMQLIYASNINPNLIDKAFEKLQQNIVEIPNKDERLQVMATYYTSVKRAQRDDIMPMLPENKDRVTFNGYVRDKLKVDGTLSGSEIYATILVSKDLTAAEKGYALSFEAGEWIRFNKNIQRLNIKTGDYYQVTECKHENLILRNDKGVVTSWNPYRHSSTLNGAVEVYRQESRGIMAGDIIRWRKNFESKGIVNSETATVMWENNSKLSIKLSNSNIIEIDLNERSNQHFDHAYGSTVHIAQGLDKANPIGLLDGPKPYLVEIDSVAKGSIIVIPGNAKDKSMSKVGQVIEDSINSSAIKAVDREGNEHLISNKHVEVYPDFEKTKHQPLSNICNFLVQATRGDNFIVFVDNIEGYKASLKHSLSHLKKTALEMVDVQQGKEFKNKVAQMTSQVFGLAKPDELKNMLLKIHDAPKVDLGINKELNLNFQKSRSLFNKDSFHLQLDNLKIKLNQDPLRFASQILGSPVTKTSTYANFAMGKDRTKGNLTLDIAGSKAGLWCDHRTGEGGDLVSLYANQYNLGYIAAAKKLFSEQSIKELPQSLPSQTSLAIKNLQQTNEEQARAKSIKQATQLYESAQPIKGSLADKYLTNIRAVKSGIPDDFKFAPRCWHKDLHTRKPALLVPAYDASGKLQSVNRIYLGHDANKLNIRLKTTGGLTMQATQKAVLGPSKAATVFINKVENSPVTYITEGVENALSIRQGISNSNISSCFGIGQLKNIALSADTKTVVICADNDGGNLATKKALIQSVSSFLDRGLEVKLALPFGRDQTSKYDYNQMLTDSGSHAIKLSLQQAVVLKTGSDLGNDKTPLYQSFTRLYEQQFGKSIGAVTKNFEVEKER